MEFTQVFSIGIGAIGVCGGVAVLLNGARKDGLIKVLAQEADSLRNQLADARSENSTIKAERDGFKRQAEDLKDLAQGSPQLVVLTAEFKKFGEAIQSQTAAFNKYIKKQEK